MGAAMIRLGSLVWVAALVMAGGPAAAQGLFVYPKAGQSQAQQSNDQSECAAWATGQTGFNPSTPPPAPPAAASGTQQGSVARGAAGGAIGGAVIGGIAGDAGKGAAIGAAAGGLVGGMRRRQSDQQQAQVNAQYQQQVAEYNARLESFNRAYAACLEARDYTVK